MANRIEGKKVAILAADGFEESELFQPLQALRDAGATVEIVSNKAGQIEANVHREKGKTIAVDRTLDQAKAEDYDALMIPGGVFSPDALRIDQRATDFARAFVRSGKVVGAICHGPWVLINAGCADGRSLTSYPTIRKDLQNAGADVRDQAVVVDDGLVSSRGPDDLPAFCPKLVEEIAEGRHERADPNRPAGKDLPGAMM